MPKKAKKGGGGGKTEEERLLYLQQRAQAEEEMAKKKEEILTLFLKDKLQKEEKNTAVNLLKLNEGWRSILRQTRAAELRKDITVLSQTFERQLDGLNNVIKNLERDLQEAERQSAQVRRVHLQHLERLWAQQDKRLMVLQQQWEDALHHLSSRFRSERKQMLAHSQQQRADLEDATFTVEQQHKEVMNEIHRLYSESIASYQSTHEDRVASLGMEDKVGLKAKALQNQETLQLRKNDSEKLDELVLRNQRYIKMTEEVTKTIKELQDAISQQKVKLKSSNIEKESLEQDLKAARNEGNKRTHKLRDQLTQRHSAARKQLVDLTVQSNSAAKKLQAVIAKGERVLRVAEMCRKLEGEQENVLTPSLVVDNQRSEREELTKEIPEFPELHQVTRRINAALLHREALKKQRDDLSRENRQLRLLLRQHLDAMTVSDHTLDGPHALLAVYQAPTTTAPSDAGRRHTVIEAVHAVKQSL
ncbi:dynein regulatory complex subunit 2 [Lates calcarifer]|uniref:Dynein regulatory complex subunit 2 n=1 Tax=Lates calcarifer TaxID=8187 RepID=A0A4W6F7F3_LATCA|nr:dynein regulatory complex subunit 2 [Lates calcarifer]XP_018531439.1 dynein regulatory complex subunit 2 [Lates calcarifer]XP_050925404.1 dynein regulatory complex subunit 2 [Lates calcarifer]XP_050925406.1 dynein regulatory complex subunit 2 [Lates calcarifer]